MEGLDEELAPGKREQIAVRCAAVGACKERLVVLGELRANAALGDRELGGRGSGAFALDTWVGGLREDTANAMRAAGIRPALIYAYVETGLIVTQENPRLSCIAVCSFRLSDSRRPYGAGVS